MFKNNLFVLQRLIELQAREFWSEKRNVFRWKKPFDANEAPFSPKRGALVDFSRLKDDKLQYLDENEKTRCLS